ncbi:MAG: hypothetical protein WC807_17755 [Hyphomicrobium sp.]|jgi:Arc/MetJ-type ribon-helix-helix transcriptional regulator
MQERSVKLRLNQQQLELLQRTVAGGAAASVVDLVRRALRESAPSRGEKPNG